MKNGSSLVVKIFPFHYTFHILAIITITMIILCILYCCWWVRQYFWRVRCNVTSCEK